jgi:SSS family solute:Na+ symporter
MHFLLIIPFLLVFSMVVIYLSSLAFPRPEPDKLTDTTFSFKAFREEGAALRKEPLYRNYRFWGGCLLAGCAVILILFS